MGDDSSDRESQDRVHASAEQQYEVAYFAEKLGITLDQAREILNLAGPSRENADAAVVRARQASAQQQQ